MSLYGRSPMDYLDKCNTELIPAARLFKLFSPQLRPGNNNVPNADAAAVCIKAALTSTSVGFDHVLPEDALEMSSAMNIPPFKTYIFIPLPNSGNASTGGKQNPLRK
ncbi:hypothetical protein D9619_011821 [Psilocybe cf. subviscida]|uniref:Uncharacterized protein n=1 Tax=Psilocybe cf. subviscida TaxID=2480587 RepID=A0A8H5B0H5_9AGAR|nr:hypothetical protein D9619_011821 [Psilocybe cf. subviscida]